jgi:WS/DGAT/MGAT family acyltransferase
MPDAIPFEHRMSDADALAWRIERDPMLRSTIIAVALLDRAPDRDRLRELIDRGTRVVPRMRHRVRGNPYSLVPPRWEVDPYFDLDFHLRWVGAHDGMRSVLDIAQPLAMQSFDSARPQWEIVVVEGLAGGRAALVVKIHHAIPDGVGAVQMGLVMFELERDPAGPPDAMPEQPPSHVLNPFERLVDGVQHEAQRERDSAGKLLGALGGAATTAIASPNEALRRAGALAGSVGRMLSPATAPLSPLMTGRSLSVHFETITVPLDAAKAAAKRANGTLNDAFVAATAEGFRRYHDRHGVAAGQLRMTMPISVREADADGVGGNEWVPARFAIPLTISDPAERMRTLHRLVAEQRAEPALALVEPMAGVLNRLPRDAATAVFGSMLKGVDLVTSNVPGAPIPLYTAGARIDAMYALGPLSGAAANLTLLSYLDEVHIGVNLDPAAVPDPDVLVDSLVDGWADVGATATRTGSPATAPAPAAKRPAAKRLPPKRTTATSRPTKRATKQ